MSGSLVSQDSTEPPVSSGLLGLTIFDPGVTSLDAPESPLSDYPDDLSDSSMPKEDVAMNQISLVPASGTLSSSFSLHKRIKTQAGTGAASTDEAGFASPLPTTEQTPPSLSLHQEVKAEAEVEPLSVNEKSYDSPPPHVAGSLPRTSASRKKAKSKRTQRKPESKALKRQPRKSKTQKTPDELLAMALAQGDRRESLRSRKRPVSYVPDDYPELHSSMAEVTISSEEAEEVEPSLIVKLPVPRPQGKRQRTQGPNVPRSDAGVEPRKAEALEVVRPEQTSDSLERSHRASTCGPHERSFSASASGTPGRYQRASTTGPPKSSRRPSVPSQTSLLSFGFGQRQREAIAEALQTPPTQVVEPPLPVHGDSIPDVASLVPAITEPTQPGAVPQPTLSPVLNPNVELELEELARRMLARPASRPPPSGKPEVWADTRQELCETLHYYRAYNSGAYCTGGFAWGMMYSKSPNAREYADSNVYLARSGGGMVKNLESGEMELGRDQSESSQVLSLRNSMKCFTPVVVITDIDNPTMPTKPPHTYCVLDYFKPTHIWCEKTRGKTLVRYRLEKLNPSKPSWWQAGPEPVALGELGPPVVQTCTMCKAQSEQVYLQGWMCLQSSCASFWTLADGNEPKESELLYDPRFVKQKTVWPNDNHNYSLKSNDVELSAHAIAGEDCSRAYWAGMVCPDCGRCVMRLSWMGWECSCGFTKTPPHALIPAKALVDPYFPLTTTYTLSRDVHQPNVKLMVDFQHNYRINKYTLPGIDGFVTHFIANKPIVEEAGGPNDMFEELQTCDIGLRRRSLGHSQTKGDTFTRHFVVNYGMPYKFVAATSSMSFDGAANAITSTRSRLNWASKFIAADTHQDFNEVLALGYFEQQKISYHDDGEFGLGPTIATLSLGAPGTMKLRMKAKHYNGVSKAGNYEDDDPKPGCEKYAERLAAAPGLATLKAAAPKEYRQRLKSIAKELGLKPNGQAKDAINMTLGHGDIVIMHGSEIQKYYEHAVEHGGKLRFALTCRYIDPDSLKEADKPEYEVAPDTGVYDGSKVGQMG